MRRAPRPQTGFTLIEVMITVAIVGILAAVALPSYTSYLRRGELPQASSQLSAYRLAMEQYYLDNRDYGNSDTCAPKSDGTSAITSTSGTRFTYTCTLSNSNQSYTLTATGSGTRTTGYDYTLDQNNTRTTTKFGGVTQTGKNCWLIKGSEC